MEIQESVVNEELIDKGGVERRQQLFKKYIEPHQASIYSLCLRYSFGKSHIDDNYNECLANFFRYIETYDSQRPLKAWLHIVTKRFILELESKRAHQPTSLADASALTEELPDREEPSGNIMGIANYRECYNDDILAALDSLKLIYREALLLQQAGYKLDEIAEISFQNGHLKTKNVETIKSRLFLARQYLQQKLTRNGEAREN